MVWRRYPRGRLYFAQSERTGTIWTHSVPMLWKMLKINSGVVRYYGTQLSKSEFSYCFFINLFSWATSFFFVKELLGSLFLGVECHGREQKLAKSGEYHLVFTIFVKLVERAPHATLMFRENTSQKKIRVVWPHSFCRVKPSAFCSHEHLPSIVLNKNV